MGDYRPVLRQLSGNGSFSFYAHSGARAAESVATNCAVGEFFTGAVLARCTVQCLSVSGFIGMGNGTATPPSDPGGAVYTVSGYAADGSLLDSQDVALDGPGALTGFSLDPAGSAAMTFVKLRSSGSGNTVLVDDLTYVPDPSALPTFTLTSTSLFPAAFLSPGGTTTKTYAVVRSNGSDGELTPQLPGLPAGISATFSPTSFPGTSDGTLSVTLTAGDNAPASGATDVTLSLAGPPTAGSGGGHDFTVHVDPTFAALASLPNPVAPWCTRQARTVSIFTRDGAAYSGPVTVTASTGAAGWNAGVVSSPVQMTGGVATATVVYEHASNAVPDSGTVTVSAHPAGRPGDAVSTSTPVTGQSPTIVQPSVSVVPPLGDHQAGTGVSLTGSGFCPGSRLLFGNDKAAAPMTTSQPPDAQLSASGVTNRQTITANTPRLATSGVLAHDAGFGFVPGPSLTATGFRNSAGFAFDNYAVGDLVYQDMTDAFGEDQTYLHIDLCFPFGCTIKVRDPVAMIYTAIVRAETVGTTGSGHCYGMSLTAALMRAGMLSPTTYPPGSAGDAWHLDGTAGPSAPLARTIQANHLKQFGLTFLDYWIKQHVSNAVASGNDIVTQVRDAVDNHGGALITIADHGGGHVVLAHSIEDVSASEHWIDLYDPNYPFLASEQSDFSGATHEGRVDGSRIHVVGNTWTLVFPDSTVWTGDTRGLLGGSIIVVPLDEAKKKQLLPSLVSIPQLLEQIIGFGSTGGDTTVTGGSALVRYGATNQTTTAGLFLAEPAAKGTASRAAGATTVGLDSSSDDTVDGFAVDRGTVVVGTLTTSGGSSTDASVVDHGLSLTPDTDTGVELMVARSVTGVPVRTTVVGTAPATGVLALRQTGAGLWVQSSEPTTLSLTFDSSGPEGGSAARTVRVSVPGGQDLTVATGQLLGSGSTVEVRVGGVAHTLPVRPSALGTVAIGRLKAAGAGARTAVTATVRIHGRTGSGAVVMTLTNRSGAVVAQKTFSVKMAAVRKGWSVTYRWRPRASGRLVAHVGASLAPTTGSTGLVGATRSVKVG